MDKKIDPITIEKRYIPDSYPVHTDYFLGVVNSERVFLEAGSLVAKFDEDTYLLLHTRLSFSPKKVKMLRNALDRLIKDYESLWGKIDEGT